MVQASQGVTCPYCRSYVDRYKAKDARCAGRAALFACALRDLHAMSQHTLLSCTILHSIRVPCRDAQTAAACEQASAVAERAAKARNGIVDRVRSRWDPSCLLDRDSVLPYEHHRMRSIKRAHITHVILVNCARCNARIAQRVWPCVVRLCVREQALRMRAHTVRPYRDFLSRSETWRCACSRGASWTRSTSPTAGPARSAATATR